MPDLITEYFTLQQQIHDYFGYVEDWVVLPLMDYRNYFWNLEDRGTYGGSVTFSKQRHNLYNCLYGYEDDEFDGDDIYSYEIYTQRFLPKWVYPGEESTLVCVDTGVDGNRFLCIFDNAKQVG